MAQIHFKGSPIHTSGQLPSKQTQIPDFVLVDHNLKEFTLASFTGKKKMIATVPSLDTGVCSKMTQQLNNLAKSHPDIAVIVVSADLPFAQERFCSANKVKNVTTLSMMRNKDFGKAYGVLITDGPLAGILARSIMGVDENDKVIYTELVPEITQEPDYQKAFIAME